MKIQDLYAATLTLILVAILLGVGLTVMGNMSRSVRTDATGMSTMEAVNNTAQTLNHTNIDADTATYANSSNAVTISATCFTFDNTGDRQGGAVTFSGVGAACVPYTGHPVNVTYTYGAATDGSSALTDSVTNLDDFVVWFAVFVVIIMAGIIIGLIIRSFRT